MKSDDNLPTPDDIEAAVHDEERLEAVREVSNTVTPDEIFSRLSRRACELLKAPVALISLVESDKDIIYGEAGLPPALSEQGYIDAHPSFCQLTVTAAEPVVINDAHANPTLRLFPSVAQMGVRAHLGIPLKIDGQPVGNCCVLDFVPRTWTPEDVKALSELAAEALDEMKAARPAA